MFSLLNRFEPPEFAGVQHAAPEKAAEIQAAALRRHVAYAVARSRFYQELFKACGAEPGDINSPSDLAKLPFTSKEDVQRRGAELTAAAPGDIADLCLTSATSSELPTVIPQTESDLARLAYNELGAFEIAGLSGADTLLICAALDRCFMAGLAYFLGALRLGARAVRGGAGGPARHWGMVKATSPTAIVGVPSSLRQIADFARSELAVSPVRKLLAIGESVRDAELRPLPLVQRLESDWNADVLSTYASTELATSFQECFAKRGGHLRPELIVVEIVGPDGRAVPDGVAGEVVVTPLGVTGMPLLRFRTNDIAFVIPGPCPCGRTTGRLGPVLGRRNQMLKFKGTTLFPNAILAALEGKDYFLGGYVEASVGPDGSDWVTLFAAVSDPSVTAARLKEEVGAKLRVAPDVELLGPEELERRMHPGHKGKRITFVDRRRAGF